MKYYKINISDFNKYIIEDVQTAEFLGGNGVLATEKELDLPEITEEEYTSTLNHIIKIRSLKNPTDIEKLWDAVSFMLTNNV